jgi:oligoribonuclease
VDAVARLNDVVKRQDSSERNHIVWLDCEMTGLSIDQPGPGGVFDEIVEIGVIVTDGNLTPVNDGINLVIKPSDASLSNMNSFVTEMHRSSGLLEKIPAGISVAEAEQRVLGYLKKSLPGGRQSAPMGGNTISMDRRFLAKYMPAIEDYVHYRNVDVSGIKELVGRWFPYIKEAAPKKTGNHRALSDAVDSIRELAYYRELLFNVSAIADDRVRKSAAAAAALFDGIGS